jgi:hypothetical protein
MTRLNSLSSNVSLPNWQLFSDSAPTTGVEVRRSHTQRLLLSYPRAKSGRYLRVLPNRVRAGVLAVSDDAVASVVTAMR